ncbi:NUDIX hydrolase domain-like protein [Parachaetomium inaequale]|uniref:NUDIX hydrolase domain-like protein n=1 Tax=Parachaetomium inaequale TaxID=2588326 RepID=A0AAN6PE85_9PEZI|nr:NUDIX hydrolase domain-like protein [Parachaetomium inaequale]
MSAGEAKVISTEPLLASEAVWTKLVKKTYRDPNGVTRTWESAERSTRPKGSDIDGVGIVAILEKETGPEIVLQKQYRPPLDKIVIELPAGLIDEGETAEQAAVRELKEETGYVAEVLDTSPVMFQRLPENQDLKPDLEENEFIEVFLVKLADLWEACIRLEAEGYAIDARIANLAEGIEIAKKFKL